VRDYSRVKRIVVKVGTNLLSSSDGIDDDRIDAISAQIAALKERGYQVLLVSSGSIGLGAKELRINGKVKQIPLRQACASIGQPLLMTSWRRSFKKSGLLCSQVLLTRRDLNNRLTYVNLRNSITTLLDLGVVPVFNENDTVSTVEIGVFGDNDRMSAMVASRLMPSCSSSSPTSRASIPPIRERMNRPDSWVRSRSSPMRSSHTLAGQGRPTPPGG